MTGRTGRTGRTGGIKPKGTGRGRLGGAAGQVSDALDVINNFDIVDGETPGMEELINLPNDWGIIISEDEGPIHPMDCKRWPKSIFCEGDLRPNPLDTGLGIDNITLSECQLIFEIGITAFGFAMPTGKLGIQFAECLEKPPEPPEPEPPPPEFPWPPDEDPGNSKTVKFNCSTIWVVVWHNGGNSGGANWRAYLRNRLASGKNVFGRFTVSREESSSGNQITVYFERWQHYLRNEDGTYFRTESNDLVPIPTSFKLGRKGSIDLYYHTLSGMDGPRSFAASITVDEERARAGYSPYHVIKWLRDLHPIYRATVYGAGALESRDYPFGDYMPEYDGYYQNLHTHWALWPEDKNNCSHTVTETLPQPRMKKDCCDAIKAVLRKTKRIEAVLQPQKFLEFDKKGNPTKAIGAIPKRLTTPGGDGYEKLAGYSDTLGALVRMLDRISGFWPATVEIADIDPNTEGNQEFSLQIHSISDGFKQALEALAHLVMHSSTGSAPKSDPEEDPTHQILAAILTEVGLTHKIAAITQHTANNIEEFLDYKVRQQEEFLPMAFNPLAEPTWKNLEYTKPTKEQVDLYIKQLLTPSTQDIVVTKNEETKFFTEWMMELLKHSSAASAALTQQVKSKEDLKKALGTARFNALVAGALNMEQIRRVLGLPSNWDLEDFADNLEDNFHPDENVEPSKHAETKPKQAKEKPRIKDISKNGRRRKR